MRPGRLDNGRLMVKPIQVMDTTQDETNSEGPTSAPQARSLTLQDIDNLLSSKVWTTHWDDNGETTAVHVEIKECGDRYKYILGNSDKNEGCVLLSKQHLLTNSSEPFVTFKGVCIQPVAMLARSSTPRTSARRAKTAIFRVSQSTKGTQQPLEESKINAVKRQPPHPGLEMAKTKDSQGKTVKDGEKSGSEYSSMRDGADARSSTEEAQVAILKRKRPAPGAYKQPPRLKIGNKARTRQPTTNAEDSKTGKHTKAKTELVDLLMDEYIMSSEEDDSDSVPPALVQRSSKKLRAEDWDASSD